MKLNKDHKKFIRRYWKWVFCALALILAVLVSNPVLASFFEVMAAVGFIDLVIGADILPIRRKKVYKKLRDTIKQVEQEIKNEEQK